MGPKEVSRRIIPEIASGLKCLPIWLILLSTVYFLFGPAFTIPSNMVLRPYGPPRPFYASLTAPPLEHLGCALSHLCHMVLGNFSILNIWEWTHVQHCLQHMSRCPPMRFVALQSGLPIVRGGLYAPWGRSHVLQYLPLLPFAIEQIELTAAELVISSSHLVAKGVLTAPDQLHISYVHTPCLLYTSPSPRDKRQSRMPSSA